MMVRLALEIGIPADKILLVNCGRRPIASTLTQFQVLKNDSRFTDDFRTIIVVSSFYHLPRIARIIPGNSPDNIHWHLHACPKKNSRVRITQKIIDREIARILKDASEGLLVEEPIKYLH